MRHIYGSARLSKDVDYVLVMTINEMVTEKIRAMYQRGNPRDVYDLWFVFSHDHIRLDQQVICQLIPEKFRQPFVAGGWNRGRLYDRVHQEAHAWDATLRDLVPEYPSLDDALSLIERSLRFLPR
ncbi:MAG: nucleotidyl transferase AbiEii/AbiGii toxin family protein [Chloroflexi bacterium]|nr:nucleotidyl transferase AbiEii/AbiGii toxin family protein [Chloroflexota bacterium]